MRVLLGELGEIFFILGDHKRFFRTGDPSERRTITKQTKTLVRSREK